MHVHASITAMLVTVSALGAMACPMDPALVTSATEAMETTGGSESTGTIDTGDASTTSTTAAPGTTDDESGGSTVAPTTGSTEGVDTTGDEGTGAGSDETGQIPVPEACEHPAPPRCANPVTKCNLDKDRDGIDYSCDNDKDIKNPDQADLDGDGFGDVGDLCPTIASDSNTLDTDKDGVGNDCDVCPRSISKYNSVEVPMPFYMRVRNIPQQADSDRDGVGDACDNCVRKPNCQGYGDGPGLTPYVVGTFIDLDAQDCQSDVIDDQIGDTCVGAMMRGAAGPVGFGDDHDFDQDGLSNIVDGCPRQPVKAHKCSGPDDCPDGAVCTPDGRCNHADHDSDGVGDICDTCPDHPNPQQITEDGAYLDDPDNDFIGNACERDDACADYDNARPFAFYDVSVGGRCCVTIYDGALVLDPDGKPLDVDDLGPRAAGVFELPPGCDEALANSADGKAHKIEACNVDDPGELWDYLCLLPARDQDYDDIPDRCDLCQFTNDPSNAIYIDANDKEWPNYGKYCHGEYDPKLNDPANMCEPKP